ncbi:MAG: hypothetical protein IKG46_11285 [Solobacterium sp.]|nr:hypothetical protein [Solobacterium sp.]
MSHIKERFSIQLAKNPSRVILVMILLANILFICFSALLISILAPKSLHAHGFWACVYYTITMVLDAGCISYVIEEVGTASVTIIIVCVLIVLIGMVIFTGAVIGYVTNYISEFISDANNGANRLHISGHTIILNWNSRGSEIVNDLLFSDDPETVIILTPSSRETVLSEINERLQSTIDAEERLNGPAKHSLFRRRDSLRNRVTVIVREGNTYSTKQLTDICIKEAKAVILLGQETANDVCKYNAAVLKEENSRGNSNIVKTLIQVASLTGAQDSADNQRIVVEITEPYTERLIEKIIEHKENLGKCNIVPLRVNRLLGQLLSQFTIMPELNAVYSDLFSNRGGSFYCENKTSDLDILSYRSEYMKTHFDAVPLDTMKPVNGDGIEVFYMAAAQNNIHTRSSITPAPIDLKINPDFWMKRKNIIILGHDSNIDSILEGYMSYRNEWNFINQSQIEENYSYEILNLFIIDTEQSLREHDYYRQYPFVTVHSADIFDRELITDLINSFVDITEDDTSILILSDDRVSREDLDASVLIYLIYVYDIISARLKQDADFDISRIDVIVEIQDPKNFDIVSNYSINNIVISNRYISKMIGQISAKDTIYYFYEDILTYDDANNIDFSSNELYIKTVGEFLTAWPAECTASQLIRAVYENSPENNKSVVLGYVPRDTEKVVLFYGHQEDYIVRLTPRDKLVIFSNH